MNLKKSIAVLMLLAGVVAYGHDFSATVDGNKIYFEITSKTRKTAKVTYQGSITEKNVSAAKGIVTIPDYVMHDGIDYTINAIGAKAFTNATEIETVVMPSTIEKVGDFAFEGCSSLVSILFPAQQVEFGTGVFFRCYEIKDVTFGSDWTKLRLDMFRWSKKLETVNVPAKVKDIKGWDKLKYLNNIVVERNNPYFSSEGGMLLTKDGKELIICPRNYETEVVIPDGCEVIRDGALYNCINTEILDFPESLVSVSFRETARMKNLQKIIMPQTTPIVTGYNQEGTGFFFFQMPNSSVEIEILKTAKPAYLAALPLDGGNYCVTPNGIPYMVTIGELPTKKNFKEVKSM